MAKDVSIEFAGEMSELKASLDGMESHIKSWGDKIKGIGVLAFGGWVTGKMLGQVGEFLALADEQIQAETKLEAVLKATGFAAGYTSDQLKTMASGMQDLTLFGDETILNTQAIIATFKEIKGDEFEEATKLAMDMSTVLGTDLKGSATQLSKALNDPTKGVSALADAGVSFTAQQKEMIKTLQESGDTVGAQKIILAELRGEFGGAAEAAASASGGGLKQFQNSVGDIKESIGKGLLGVLDELTPYLKDAASLVGGWAESFAAMGPVIGELVDGGLQLLIGGFEILRDTSTAVLEGLGSLWQMTFGETAGSSLDSLFSFAKDVFTGMLGFGVGFFTAMEVGWQSLPDVALFAFDGIMLGAIGMFEDLKHFFLEVAPEVIGWFADNWQDIFTDIWTFTKTIFTNMFDNVVEFFSSVWDWLSGNEASFEFKALSDGFESTLKELPNIAKREMTELEKELTKSTGDTGARIGAAFQEKFQENMKALGLGDDIAAPQLAIATGGGAGVSSEAVSGSGSGGAGKAPGKSKGNTDKDKGNEDDKGSAASFENLGSLFKRIQSSAAGTEKSPEAKVTQKVVDETKEVKDNTKKTADVLASINKHVEKIANHDSGGLG